MKQIDLIIKHTDESNQNQVDWTKAWSSKYSVLKTYQSDVDISKYANQLRIMMNELQNSHGYSKQDAMLVLKDILYHEYLDHKKKVMTDE